MICRLVTLSLTLRALVACLAPSHKNMYIYSFELIKYVIFFHLILPQIEESGEEITVQFLELIETLLKDPEARQDFFMVKFF